jgi:hypothetical protein
MPTTLDSIKKLHPVQAGWELPVIALIAAAGLLATLAMATATSLNLVDLPF